MNKLKCLAKELSHSEYVPATPLLVLQHVPQQFGDAPPHPLLSLKHQLALLADLYLSQRASSERKSSIDEVEEHHAQRPDVRLEGVKGLPLQQLGAHVVNRSAEVEQLPHKAHRKAEVNNLETFGIPSHDDILHLQIEMGDAAVVEVLHP